MTDRLIKDGKVAVVSSEYEYSWATDRDVLDPALRADMMFNRELAALLLRHKAEEAGLSWEGLSWETLRRQQGDELLAFVQERWPVLSCNFEPSLRVTWVPVGAHFRVQSHYRQGEIVEVLDMSEWSVA